ncbi:alpha-galactosidase [Paenibacillus cymbidii]|uniref:alpha-galactosidase n=1 Tax=Paenibacillus cymbidii TaxID=1639034 RepID=UPI001081A75A|nr:alpha-galactosidase [Paenibacillus cymbidii]
MSPSCVLDNGLIRRSVTIGELGQLVLESLILHESGFDWALSGSPCDLRTGFAGQHHADRQNWRIAHTVCSDLPGGAKRLSMKLEHASGLTVTQRTTVWADAAVIEHQCRVANEGTETIRGLDRFDPLAFAIAGTSGLTAYAVRRDQYALSAQPLEHSLQLRGGNWNGPEHAGWFVLENKAAAELLYVGIEWEREWELDAVLRPDGGYDISAGVVRYSRDLAPGEAVESPRMFVGLAHGELDDAVQQMLAYLAAHVFPPQLPGFPWVSYDIWSTDKDDVEATLLQELDFAADMGVELFYIDASWYAGSSVRGEGSWGLGLGHYEEDRRKFPRGLRFLSERVHAKGMKFGLWVDPIVIDEQWVRNGLYPEHWLIRHEGVNRSLTIKDGDWPTVYHLCTGCPEVVDYLSDKLIGLIGKYKLDWMKWDDSALNNPYCSRTDHGHQAGDGNFSALLGKYEICARLMAAFPDLAIEMCGYPARLDYGMARYARSNWLSDATGSATHVLNNLQVTSRVFPASYNTSFLIHDKEIVEESDPHKLDTLVRCRLMGLIGLATLHGKLAERASLWPSPILEAFRRNIASYKSYRHLLSQLAYHVAPPPENEDWHVHLFVSHDRHEAVLFCFLGDSPQTRCQVKWKGLLPGKRYKLRCLNTGEMTFVDGSALMEQGLTVDLADGRTSNIYVLA